MDIKKYFPDSTSYIERVNIDIKDDAKVHTGLVKHLRLAGYFTHYLWIPAFIVVDIVFSWILQMKPSKEPVK
jgi:hypothetical protein